MLTEFSKFLKFPEKNVYNYAQYDHIMVTDPCSILLQHCAGKTRDTGSRSYLTNSVETVQYVLGW